MANSIELNSSSLINDANLTHYYRFEANSNDSKGTQNGTDTAITYSTANGKFGQGAGFNGTTSKITFLDQIIPLGAKSIGFWVNSSSTAEQIIYDNSGGTPANNGGFIEIVPTTGVIRYESDKGATPARFNLSTTGVVNNGVFHFVVCTWDGTTNANGVKIYIDGLVDTQGTAATTETLAATNNMSMGALSGTAQFFLNGALDDFWTFSRALTSNEISNLWNLIGGAFLFNLI